MYRKKKRRKTPFAKCACVCDSEKLRTVKEQEASEFLEDTGKAIIPLFAVIAKALGS